MNARPIGDRVIIRRTEKDTSVVEGLAIPQNSQEKAEEGEVVAISEGWMENGVFCIPKLKVGEKVLFGKHAGHEKKINSETLLIMREEEVFAVLEN